MSTISSINSYDFTPLINNSQLYSHSNLLSENISEILEQQSSLNTISEMGSQINKIYSFVKSTKNDNVIGGFKTSMFLLNNQLTGTRAIKFFKTAENLTVGNVETFASLFSSVDNLNKNGFTGVINNFMDTVNNISEKIGSDKLKNFLEITDKLSEKLGAENTNKASQIMFSFFNTANTLLKSSSISKENKNDLFNDLISKLSKKNTSTEIESYLKKFRENNI